jgi:hypothetical protein
MAELLIFNRDNRTGLRNADESGKHVPGEVIDIKPDGFRWSGKERPPYFVLVRLPGVPVEKVQDLLEPKYSPLVGVDGKQIMRARRKSVLKLAELPTKDRTDLTSGKVVDFSEVALRDKLEVKR